MRDRMADRTDYMKPGQMAQMHEIITTAPGGAVVFAGYLATIAPTNTAARGQIAQ